MSTPDRPLDRAAALLARSFSNPEIDGLETEIAGILRCGVSISAEPPVTGRAPRDEDGEISRLLTDREGRPLGELRLAAGPRHSADPALVELCALAVRERLRERADRLRGRETPTLTRLLEEVLQGTVTDQAYIDRVLSLERFPRKKHFFFVFVETSNGPGKQPDEKLLARLRNIWPISFPLVFLSNLILLVSSDAPPMEEERAARFGELLREREVYGGYSKPFPAVDRYLGYHLCRTVCAAKAACRLGLRSRFAEFDAVAPTAMLFADQMPYGARKCVDPRLLELLEADARNGTEYLRTLFVFWEHRCDRDAAAGELRIHRNTLGYRLRRIEELLACSLSDPRAVTALHVSLAQLRCLGALENFPVP